MKRLSLFIIISLFSIVSFNNTFLGNNINNFGVVKTYADQNLLSPSYEIEVGNLYPGISAPSGKEGSKEIANWLLGNIIQNMMIALGSISILVMTIGAGYMILHSGQEDMLSRGKTIFLGGVYAMVIALSSYLIIAAVRFLLFGTA